MEPLDVVRWFVTTQLLLGLTLLLAKAVAADPRGAVRHGRVLLVSAFVAPLLVPLAPIPSPVRPAAQVFAGSSFQAAPTLSLAIGSEPRPPIAVEDAGPWLLAGAVLFALVVVAGAIPLVTAAISLRRLLHDAVPVRRIGRVRIVVSASATAPFAAWLPGSAWVVLDAHTFADAERRRIAVQHELQHHRHRDTAWAWLLLGLGVLGASTPIVTAWRVWLADHEELAVDAAVVRRVPPRTYARVLHDAAERALRPPVACPGLTVSGSKTQLTRRITMIVDPAPLRNARRALLLTVLGVPLVVSAAFAADGAVADRRISVAKARAIARSADAEIPLVVNDVVVAELNRLVATPGGRRYVSGALEARDGELGQLVLAALEEAGLPEQLAAVALVESGFQNLGYPGVNGGSYAPGIPGAGLWMFIPATARTYGLRVDAEVDERLDPELETGAAIALLSDLHERYGDWWLAFAGYNQGEKRVDKAIAEGGTRDAFELQRKGLLNEYAAQVAAAMIVLEDESLAR
jgi:membrane-bound lytic murein transglycosylase D